MPVEVAGLHRVSTRPRDGLVTTRTAAKGGRRDEDGLVSSDYHGHADNSSALPPRQRSKRNALSIIRLSHHLNKLYRLENGWFFMMEANLGSLRTSCHES